MPVAERACKSGIGACGRLAGLLALLLPALTGGQGIDVERAELYLRGGRLPSGAWGCGFAILANHRTREDPHVEWDINVEQVNNGSQIRTEVTAASFTVTRKSRSVRPLTGPLSFAIDQDPQPILVRTRAAAGAGTVEGDLSAADATRLFAAVGAGSFITITVGAAQEPDGSLRFHLAHEGAGPGADVFSELCKPVATRR
jgi:hypothetical protein